VFEKPLDFRAAFCYFFLIDCQIEITIPLKRRIDMKKLLLCLLCISIFTGGAAAYDAGEYAPIKDCVALKVGSPKAYAYMREIMIDAENPAASPFVTGGRTMVPVRFISESFGCEVLWNDAEKSVTVKSGKKTAVLKINSDEMHINDDIVILDEAPRIVDSRVYLPLRCLAEEVLDKQVFYDRGLILIGDNTPAVAPGSSEADLILAMFKNSPRAPYMIYYGELNDDVIKVAKRYKIVILHPAQADLTRSQVEEIQKGFDPSDPSDDVNVIGYVSIGEDVRTTGMTPQQMLADGRFTGDGTGPRVDPRGEFPNGNTDLSGIDPKGAPSPGGSGFASYYLDDNDRDGLPDFNKSFNGAFVNAGDPAWYDILNAMTKDSVHGLHGLREILTTDYGRGLGCDGIFIDTVDTCAPNSYTDENSFNQSEFEWTAPGVLSFVKRLRNDYPDKLLVQNRGLFMFHPWLGHYKYNTGAYIDYLMFESFRLDSSQGEAYNPSFFADNSNNYAPKISAEANRPYGFVMLGLSYAEGPEDVISSDVLTGRLQIGLPMLLEELEIYRHYGFIPYITNGWVTLANTFAMDNMNKNDVEPPVWSSTHNNDVVWPPKSPEPRVGIQAVEEGEGSAIISWDVALDQSRVRYRIYYQKKPFDFEGDPNLEGAQISEPLPRAGKSYRYGTSPDSFANEAVIADLESGETYYFVVRAYDEYNNEEKNQRVLSAKIK
jgi:hypothetical protein